MLRATTASRGMIVAPHHLAAQAGLSVLREGGNAIEAIVAAAATIAVVYPHMNGLGGDGFWLIKPARGQPLCVLAAGRSGANVTPEYFSALGLSAVPARGGNAAITVAGTVGGWQEALAISSRIGGRMRLERLFEDAIYHAEHGFPASDSQKAALTAKLPELRDAPGFVTQFLAGNPGSQLFRQPRMAETLRRLCRRGLRRLLSRRSRPRYRRRP